MGYITFPLDEDRPFIYNGWTLDIPVYGLATIRYTSIENWWLDELEIDATKAGEKDTRLPIGKGEQLFLYVSSYLTCKQSDDIAEAIRNDIREQHESRLFDEGKERAKLGRAG